MTIDRATRHSIGEGAALLRKLAQRAGNGWDRVDDEDGTVRIECLEVEIALQGGFRSGAADYLLALNPDVGSALAELLWQISLPADEKRRGDGDRIANQAARLVSLMQRGVSRRT